MILSLETICFADFAECLSCLQICQVGGVSLCLILDSPFKTHSQDSILTYLSPRRRIRRFNTSGETTCDELFIEKQCTL